MYATFRAVAAAWVATIGVQATSQLIFDGPQHSLHDQSQLHSHELRVAIVGAGAAGSSAAFWLSRAKARLGENITVTLYDRANYIGGRSTTVRPYDDESITPVELGASIYVDANKNIARAVKEFNFAVDAFGDENEETGIWNGKEFVLTMNDSGGWRGWWQTVKLLWRYGYSSPTKVRTLVNNMVNAYLNLYRPRNPYSSISDISSALDFTGITAVSTAKYLSDNGVSQLFTHELVEAATRVNYGQNVNDIHALEGMVSLAANGAHTVAGGNWQVFERWVKESGARVHLGTSVQTLRRSANDKWHLTAEGAAEETYDVVVLAAPIRSTNISIEAPDLDFEEAFPPVDYVHLHVTLLATTVPHPQASYFFPGAAPGTKIPQTILTTSSGPVEPEFNSISYHERIQRAGKAPEYIVKIFSKARVNDEWLEKMFGAGNVGWVYRKQWDAYPVLPPTTKYPSIKPMAGLYYVNAFEPFISTMETETIASLNAIDLLLYDRYERGVCGYKKGKELPDVTDDFVFGWDC